MDSPWVWPWLAKYKRVHKLDLKRHLKKERTFVKFSAPLALPKVTPGWKKNPGVTLDLDFGAINGKLTDNELLFWHYLQHYSGTTTPRRTLNCACGFIGKSVASTIIELIMLFQINIKFKLWQSCMSAQCQKLLGDPKNSLVDNSSLDFSRWYFVDCVWIQDKTSLAPHWTFCTLLNIWVIKGCNPRCGTPGRVS